MLDFLLESYQPWPDILDGEEDSHFRGPGSVEGRATHIGFEYHNHITPEKSYNYAVLRWMALRVGRRRKQFREGSFNHLVPYYVVWPPGKFLTFPVIPGGDSDVYVPPPYRDFVVDPYGLLATDRTARDLAWRNIPEGTFERVSATHVNGTSKEIREALVQSGIERARIILQFIRAEISRLDALWND
jgi:hypothetical protein